MNDKRTPDEPDVDLPAASKGILWGAGIFTVVWIIAAAVFAFGYHGTIALPTRLNEWGDFAAGVFAPIAFVWLVVAVLLQSTELREQRKELALTRAEFKHNRDVMRAQAGEAKNQATYILKQTELLEKNEANAEAERVFDDAVEHIATRLRQYVGSAWKIIFIADWDNDQPLGSLVNFRKSMYDGEDDILVIASTVQVLRTGLRELRQEHPDPELRVEFPYDFQRVYRAVVMASKKIDDLPLRFKEKAATLELDELKKHMTFVADQAGIMPFGPVSAKPA